MFAVLFAGRESLQAQSIELPRQAASWSGQEFAAKLERAHRALTNTHLEAAKTQQIDGLTANERQEFFDRFLEEIFASEDYAKAQADAWMLDHFQIDYSKPESMESVEQAGWDTDSYRKWLIQSFHRNTLFDAFLQSQLVGTAGDGSNLPTHAWYLAGQRSEYQIAQNLSPIESNLTRQFQTALDSIQKTETKDQSRLIELCQKDNNEIKRWWQSLRIWPTIPGDELVWSWPKEGRSENSDPIEVYEPKEGQALRGFREWTLVIDAKIPKQMIDTVDPILLFAQGANGKTNEEPQRTLLVELRQGRVCVGLIHDARISFEQVQTQEAVAAEDPIQIAVVNDGLGRPDSVRILVNGQTQATKRHPLAKGYLKEIVFGKNNRWVIGKGASSGAVIEQVQVYRLALSPPECRGLAQCPWTGTWEEIDEPNRAEWIEHYARRVDVQWRYQRESRGHYVANLAAVKESASMTPVLRDANQPIYLTQTQRFPNTLLSIATPIDQTPEQVATTTPKDWRESGSRWELEAFAKAEANRTWQSMLRYADMSDRQVAIPERLVS
ncbi:MAG: DUF1549 domain-containing protein, partial [Pirellula sp.]